MPEVIHRIAAPRAASRIGTEHPDASRETFDWDAEGNRVVWIRETGQRIEQDYDGQNRLLETRHVPASPDGLERVTRSYDGNGNLLVLEEHRGAAVRRWSASYDVHDQRVAWVDGDGLTFGQAFDANGNRIERTGPEGTTGYAYDVRDRLVSVTPPGGVLIGVEPSPAGRLSALSHAGGVRTEVGRDGAGRVTGVVHRLGAAALLLLGYTLDANGHRTAEVWERPGERVETRYGLDLAERLTSIEVDGRRVVYTLDASGNRTAESSPEGERIHSYDARDRLVETRLGGVVEARYGYDAAGRQLSVQRGAQSRSYVYDAEDRLLAVSETQSSRARTRTSILLW